MNELFIEPNVAKKTMRISGVIAAGEHVRVTARNTAGMSSETTRLRVLCGDVLVAQFPMPKSGDSWESDGNDISCVLNLNTVQAERVTKCAPVPCLFVLDDVSEEVRQLYGTSTHRLERWVKSPDNDVPIDLDTFPSVIDSFRLDIAEWKTQVGDSLEDYQLALSSAWNDYRNSLDSHFSQLAASVSAAVAEKAGRGELERHVSDGSNPHNVTAQQIGAATTEQMSAADAKADEAKAAAASVRGSIESETARAKASELEIANSVRAEEERARSAEEALGKRIVDAANEYKNPLKDESDRAKGKELDIESALIAEENRARGEEVSLWRTVNGKQASLSAGQLDAVNSGINAAKVSQISSNAADISAERTRAQMVEAMKADLVGGKVPASQLPSYVDDVLEFDSASAFPSVGESGKIYIAKDTNIQYRWSGTRYVQLGGGGAGEDTNAVHYYSETRTEEDKAQARKNIGARGLTDFDVAGEATGYVISNDIRDFECKLKVSETKWVESTDPAEYVQRGVVEFSSSGVGAHAYREYFYGTEWVHDVDFGTNSTAKPTDATFDTSGGDLESTVTMQLSAAQKLVRTSATVGIAKIGEGGVLTVATKSSDAEENADYRDPKDAKCYDTKFGEWTFKTPPSGYNWLSVEFEDGVWSRRMYDIEEPSSSSLYTWTEDGTSTEAEFVGDATLFFPHKVTATRQRVATTGETFVTPSYVKDVAETYVVTDAVDGGTSVKINGETVTSFADLLAKCRTGRAVLYGQATTVETGYAFYNAASVTDSIIQFQVSGMLYDKSNVRYGMYVRRIKIVPRASGGLLVNDSGLEGPFAAKSDTYSKGVREDGSPVDAELHGFFTETNGELVKTIEGHAGGGGSQGYAFIDLTPTSEGGYKVFTAHDHSINRFTLADATPVKVILPNATDINGRDFIVKVNVTSAEMPTFEIVKPADTTSLGIEAADDGWAELEAGINYFTFTETDRAS